MKYRLFGTAALVLWISVAFAEVQKLGIYMNGTRVGTSTFSTRKEVLDGKELNRGESTTTMSTQMLGTSLTVVTNSTTWSDAAGKPVRMLFVTKSGGRTQTVDAKFGDEFVDVSTESGGAKQQKRLAIPKDAPIVDDPLPLVLKGGLQSQAAFYVLRQDTVSFSKDVAYLRGESTYRWAGAERKGQLIEVVDPMATMRVFVDSKGGFLKAEGPFGLELMPEEGDQPAADPSRKEDIAVGSSIRPEPAIRDPRRLTRFKFLLVGAQEKTLPSDEHQTCVKRAEGWSVDVHPVRLWGSPGGTVAEAARTAAAWTRPDTYIPSDSPEFKRIADSIAGNSVRVRDVALAVQKWVARRMKPNLGIGVLRDASEILASREGVCRDSAILAATLLRAKGVPTRLCSGLVSWDGTFYYHAWVEVWNGKHWLGIDPTVEDSQISAAHIKLSQGDIATAFRFPVLNKVSIRVKETQSANG